MIDEAVARRNSTSFSPILFQRASSVLHQEFDDCRYDSITAKYGDMLIRELIPLIERQHSLTISKDPMVC